jgi:hypothetical protein
MLLRTIYIAGKVTGLPHEEVAEKFNRAEEYWIEAGCGVRNPVKIINNPYADWAECMKTLLRHLTQCQAIYILDNWQTSRGTRLEIINAHAMGLDLILEDRRQQRALDNFLNIYVWKTATV